MATDTYPGLHYFCVDVETSALRTWEGFLLTIGCVVVDSKGNVVDDFYARIDQTENLSMPWFDASLPADSETLAWWREQSDFAKDEAWRDTTRTRHPAEIAARHFHEFVTQFGDDWTDRRFVADPDKFDWVWVDWLFSQARVSDPFWYHGIDIYSFKMGVAAQKRTGKAKGKLDVGKRLSTHDPAQPHHALSDAFSLAQDLCDHLEKQPIELDEPSLDEPPVSEYDEQVDEEPVSDADEPVEESEAGESEE